MSHSRISVAMCTYNGARYIREQLDSILAQTHLPDEVIVCDDGSNDETLALLRAFLSIAPFRVRMFRNNERLGPSKNFEKVIGLCECDTIVLSDQDDIWKMEKLERLSAALSANPEAIYVFSDAAVIDSKGLIESQSFWDTMGARSSVQHFGGSAQLKVLLQRNVVVGATLAFRASFREVMLPIPHGWMHDYWIACLGSALGSGFPVDECLMFYRRHPSQLCGWNKETMMEGIQSSLATSQEGVLAKAGRFNLFLQRLRSVSQTLPCQPDRLALIEEKGAHLQRRASIRAAAGFSRVAQVLSEAASGRYWRYSRSWLSIARDLWEPVERHNC